LRYEVNIEALVRQYHDSVNAILTPHQLALMKSMLGRLDSAREARRAP
jgi:hypothetical protein